MNAVILAGGIGSRLWPMSRQARPKQFYGVVGEESLVRDTYRRLLRALPAERIFISTSPEFAALIRQTLPEAADRLLIEPAKRDTGPAMGYVAAMLEWTDPDEPTVFVPSDHYIADEEKFLRCLAVGDCLVRETGKLLDIGITPTFPSTALGYIKVGAQERAIDGVVVYDFAGHTEKPSFEIAKQYLDDGRYLWHANYYCWTPRKFMESFDQFAPELARPLRQLQEEQRAGNPAGVAETFEMISK